MYILYSTYMAPVRSTAPISRSSCKIRAYTCKGGSAEQSTAASQSPPSPPADFARLKETRLGGQTRLIGRCGGAAIVQ